MRTVRPSNELAKGMGETLAASSVFWADFNRCFLPLYPLNSRSHSAISPVFTPKAYFVEAATISLKSLSLARCLNVLRYVLVLSAQSATAVAISLFFFQVKSIEDHWAKCCAQAQSWSKKYLPACSRFLC